MEQKGTQVVLQVKYNIYVENLVTRTQEKQNTEDTYQKAKGNFHKVRLKHLCKWKVQFKRIQQKSAHQKQIARRRKKSAWIDRDEHCIQIIRFNEMESATIQSKKF